MPSYDNPAGRLHELLKRLSETGAGVSLVDAWAEVLGVEPDQVSLHLGDVAKLLADVQIAVDELGEETFASMADRYRDAWAGSIFPSNHSFSTAVHKVRPDSPALDALGAIGVHLHSVASEGLVPSEAELDQLKDGVARLLDEIRQSSDLPESVRHLLVLRLTDILRAMEYVHIGGPNAVRLATEALIGAIGVGAIDLRGPEGSSPSKAKRRVATVLVAIWMAFTAGPEIQASLEAWDGLIQGELNSGSSAREEQLEALAGDVEGDQGVSVTAD